MVFPSLAAYVNRCQWLLRQGKPVADVALYTPTERRLLQTARWIRCCLTSTCATGSASGPLTSEFGLKKAFAHHSDVISTLLEAGINFARAHLCDELELTNVRNGD